jgi:hypothetical protein
MALGGNRMALTRRALLTAGTALPLLNLGPRSINPAEAVAPVVVLAFVGAAVNLLSSVLAMQEKAGATELEFAAINVKLDQILDNQRILLEAINAVDERLIDVQRAVNVVPSETLNLLAVTNCNNVLKLAVQSTQSLRDRPKDGQARTEYNTYRNELLKATVNLVSTAQETDIQPSLVFGALHALNCLKLYIIFDKQFGKVTQTDRDNMNAIAFNIIQTYESLISTRGILTSFSILEQKLNEVRSRFDQPPIPKQFGALLPKDYDTIVPSDKNGDEKGVLLPQQTICMRSGPTKTQLKFDSGSYTDSKGRPSGRWFVADSRYTWNLTKVAYSVTRFVAFGGRPFYDVGMLPMDKWAHGTWGQTIHSESQRNDSISARDPDANQIGCFDIQDAEKGASNVFNIFGAYLGQYAAIVSMQGRLLALNDLAVHGLEEAKGLHDKIDVN